MDENEGLYGSTVGVIVEWLHIEEVTAGNTHLYGHITMLGIGNWSSAHNGTIFRSCHQVSGFTTVTPVEWKSRTIVQPPVQPPVHISNHQGGTGCVSYDVGETWESDTSVRCSRPDDSCRGSRSQLRSQQKVWRNLVPSSIARIVSYTDMKEPTLHSFSQGTDNTH